MSWFSQDTLEQTVMHSQKVIQQDVVSCQQGQQVQSWLPSRISRELSELCFWVSFSETGAQCMFKVLQVIPIDWLVGPTLGQTLLWQTRELSQWNWLYFFASCWELCMSVILFQVYSFGNTWLLTAFAQNIARTPVFQLLSGHTGVF